jgi:hypothetical protein
MAVGNIFDSIKEAAGGLLGGLGEAATAAAQEAGLGDLAAQAGDTLGAATVTAGDLTAQAADAIEGVAGQLPGGAK